MIYYARSKELCKDNVHAYYVIEDVIQNPSNNISPDSFIFMALPTSPFRSIESISSALSLLESNTEIQSVVSVTKSSKPSYSIRYIDSTTGFLTKFSQQINLQEQDSKEYLVSGSLFISSVRNLLKYKTFHMPQTYGLIVSEFEALDINSELDLKFAQYLVSD